MRRKRKRVGVRLHGIEKGRAGDTYIEVSACRLHPETFAPVGQPTVRKWVRVDDGQYDGDVFVLPEHWLE